MRAGNPTKARTNPYLVLLAALTIAFGGWAVGLEAWGEAVQPAQLGSLLSSWAAALLTWLGQSPADYAGRRGPTPRR